MLSAEAAVHADRELMDDRVEPAPMLHERILFHAFWVGQIEVNIPIAEMSKRNDADAGHLSCDSLRALLDKSWHT